MNIPWSMFRQFARFIGHLLHRSVSLSNGGPIAGSLSCEPSKIKIKWINVNSPIDFIEISNFNFIYWMVFFSLHCWMKVHSLFIASSTAITRSLCVPSNHRICTINLFVRLQMGACARTCKSIHSPISAFVYAQTAFNLFIDELLLFDWMRCGVYFFRQLTLSGWLLFFCCWFEWLKPIRDIVIWNVCQFSKSQYALNGFHWIALVFR